ncbi:MAG: hypothetical protein JO316_21770 [Abitibacteriaceae bacterium]|nr:hypothetical protein [Abditibacteriaceae bacterium]
MTPDFLLPEFIKLPFSNFSLSDAVETTGFIKADAAGLHLEFEVLKHDLIGLESKSKVQEVTIPLEEIESIAFTQGWLEPMVEVTTKSVRAVSAVPGSKQGKVVLCIPDKEKKAAQELVSTFTLRISEQELARFKPPGHEAKD